MHDVRFVAMEMNVIVEIGRAGIQIVVITGKSI